MHPNYNPLRVALDKAALRNVFRNNFAGINWSALFDRNTMRRARYAYRRNLSDPGDCKDDLPLLAGLAVAEAMIGRRAGWIPEVQRIGCLIAA